MTWNTQVLTTEIVSLLAGEIVYIRPFSDSAMVGTSCYGLSTVFATYYSRFVPLLANAYSNFCSYSRAMYQV